MSSPQPANAVAILDEIRGDIAPLLAENGQSFDRLLSTFKIAVQQEPKILQCTPGSLRREISKCAADGLVPDAKEAVILYYYDKEEKAFIANYQPMVYGIIKRMRELGSVFNIICELVCQGDTFSFNAADPDSLSHFWDVFSESPRGATRAAYVIFRDNQKRVMHREIMTLAELQSVRDASKAPNSPAWKNFEGEMYQKAVLRRGSKYISINNDKIRSMIERMDDMFDFRQPAQVERVDPFAGGAALEGRREPAQAIEHQPTQPIEMAATDRQDDRAPVSAGKEDQPASKAGQESVKRPKYLEEAPAVPDVMTIDADETAAVAESFGKVLAIANEPGCSVEERRGILKVITPEKKANTPEHLHEALRVVIAMVDWCLQREAREMPWASDHMAFAQKLAAKLDVERLNVGKYQ
ncbi:Recombinase, phage RecT family [uncultured Pleomorphomonas sp.]|uniref:Recombinase, phage RecT family n=1 Tax=uncultured Pleomorphomonas sp. TaxID=442121 RepID=A0A212LQW0_9HYPH|nr:recombinase RecT [uncultured Pleomorphomonas sp.]SCM79830.1 Recombinase, phage RecT family [uncultured Pleomorphomonas sp.]